MYQMFADSLFLSILERTYRDRSTVALLHLTNAFHLSSEKTDFQATAARLKGNRFYKAKRWDEALGHYMTSLRARPYIANTLGNVAQVVNATAVLHRLLGCVSSRTRSSS